jgi:Fic family protein
MRSGKPPSAASFADRARCRAREALASYDTIAPVPSPPFRITRRILSLCAELGRLVGRCDVGVGALAEPRLRRGNRVRTIQGSVAIEGNTLSVQQVTDVMDGKRVAGPANEIREVKNAIAAYALAPGLDPISPTDFLRAHATLMRGLVRDAGRWRAGDVGVLRGSKVGHIAPRAPRVPGLMHQLLAAMAADRDTPAMVKACVAHYEIEFIHPFSDGNGRMGRLWQHVILLGESPVFALVPTESVIRDHQAEYYAALGRADRDGHSTVFVEFGLEVLKTALEDVVASLRPRAPDASQRLSAAHAHFGRRGFSRRDYLALHRGIQTATASRDLRAATAAGVLERAGDKATARYRFVRRPR